MTNISKKNQSQTWGLTFHRVNSSNTGFYQCQVFLHHSNSLHPGNWVVAVELGRPKKNYPATQGLGKAQEKEHSIIFHQIRLLRF